MAPEVIACDQDPTATYDYRVSVLKIDWFKYRTGHVKPYSAVQCGESCHLAAGQSGGISLVLDCGLVGVAR